MKKIPIKAYGKVQTKVYRAIKQITETNTCQECSVECTKGGAIITGTQNINFIEICSQPYCYTVSKPKEEERINFPLEIVVVEYDVTVKIFSNGYLIKHLGVTCSPQPYCEMITCYL